MTTLQKKMINSMKELWKKDVMDLAYAKSFDFGKGAPRTCAQNFAVGWDKQ